MKTHLILLLLSLAISEGFSQVNNSNQPLSSVYHYGYNISLRNYDGTRSVINGRLSSATLLNSDGTQSVLNFNGNTATLNAIDGTISSVFFNRLSSTVHNADGTRITINHRRNTSTCSTEYGTHTIMHTFGSVEEWCNTNVVDVLVHMNWVMQMRAEEADDEIIEGEPVN